MIRVDQEGLAGPIDHALVDHRLGDILHRRQVVHDVQQSLLQDRPKPSCAGSALDRLAGDGVQRPGPDLELYALHAKELLVLLHQRVLGFHQDLDECVLIQFLQRGHHRQAADELRDKAEFHQILGFGLAQGFGDALAFPTLHFRTEANAHQLRAVADHPVQAVESAPTYEQDVGGVYLHEILIRVLASALRRHRSNGALDQLEKRLLDTFAGNITGNGGVVRLARNLVDFVDVHNPLLRFLDVVVTLLQQLLDDVFDVLPDITGLCQCRGIGHYEGHVEEPGQRLRQQGLSRASGADEQYVALGKLYFILTATQMLEPLVMVVDGNGENAFGCRLTNHVLIEDRADFPRGRQGALRAVLGMIARKLVPNDVIAQFDALVADEDGRARDEFLHLVLALTAKRAIEQLLAARLLLCHG